MRLKSLLLSSAAALVTTGSAGAQAADVMMEEEMEPVEYVRVCDAYGSGFFYIPGSETCLRFDGYAQYQINANEDQFSKSYRFRLNVDARSDTEWGTLRGFGRIQSTGGDNSDAAFTTDQLIIQLGGFHAGYTESAFVAPWGGLGIARFGVLHTDGGGSYGYQQRNQIGYTWAGADGWSATIALEDDDHGRKPTTADDILGALAGNSDLRDNAIDLRDSASVARAAANRARNRARLARDVANTARDAADTARVEARLARRDLRTARTDAETARMAAETAQEMALQTFDNAQQAAADALVRRTDANALVISLIAAAGGSPNPTEQAAISAAQTALEAADGALTAASAAHTAARNALVARQPDLDEALVALNDDAIEVMTARGDFLTAVGTLGVPADPAASTPATGAYLILDSAQNNLQTVRGNPASTPGDILIAQAMVAAATTALENAIVDRDETQSTLAVARQARSDARAAVNEAANLLTPEALAADAAETVADTAENDAATAENVADNRETAAGQSETAADTAENDAATAENAAAAAENTAAEAANDLAEADEEAYAFQHPEDPGDGFVPDITGVVGFSQAWGGLWAKGGFDESASAGTVAVGVHVNIPDVPGSSFRMGGFYSSDPNDYAPEAPVTEEATEWSVAASYKHQFTPAISGVLGGQFFQDFDGDNSFLIQSAVVWVPIPEQMDIRLEGHYNDHDAAGDDWSGFLRFRRYF